MKILAIRLKNLASIEGNCAIDFTVEPLFSAGIFAISGATGSGKSTILDALCLALFDKAPRFASVSEKIALADVGNDRIQQSDVRNILRRGAGEGFAEVEFIGVDGKRYLSRWTVYRARRKAGGALQSQIIQVKELHSDTELQGTKTEILNRLVSLVGLTYEQFTRTVLLAQNDFATFLKSRDDVKAELLEKLTGTEIYSRISMAVYGHNKEAQSELANLKLRMGEITLLSKDETQELLRAKKEVLKEREEAKKQLELTEQQMKWYQQLSVLLNQKEEAEKEVAQSHESLRQAEPRFDLVRRTDRVQDARPLLAAKQNVRQSVLSQQLLLKRITEEAEAKKLELCAVQEEFGDKERKTKLCQQEFERLKPVLKDARELDIRIKSAVQRVSDAEKVLKESGDNRLRCEKEQQERKSVLADAIRRKELINEWVDNYSCHEKMIARTDLVLSLLDTADHSDKKILEAGRELSALDDSVKQQQQEYIRQEAVMNELLEKKSTLKTRSDQWAGRMKTQSIETVRKEQAEYTERWKKLLAGKSIWLEYRNTKKGYLQKKDQCQTCVDELTGKREAFSDQVILLEQLKQEKETVARVYDNARLSISGNVSELREHLLQGEACPVCGSADHPYVQNNKNRVELVFQSIENEFRIVSERYDKQNNGCIALASDIRNLENLLVKLEKEAVDVTTLLLQRENQWVAEMRKLDMDDPGDENREEWFGTAITEAEACLFELKKRESDYNQDHNRWQSTEKELKELLSVEERLVMGLKNAERELQRLHVESLRERANLELYRMQYQEAYTRVGQEITIERWDKLWESDHELFKRQVRKLAQLWAEKHREAEALHASIQRLTAESESAVQLLFSANETYGKSLTLMQECRESLSALKSARAALLGGRAADEVETEFREKLDHVLLSLEAARGRLSMFQNECASLQGQIQQCETSLKELLIELDVATERVSGWLKEHNESSGGVLTEGDIEELLGRDSSWLSQERTMLLSLRETHTRAFATLKERQSRLDGHLGFYQITHSGEEAFDQLNETKRLLQQACEETEERLSVLEIKLRIQQQNEDRFKLIGTELEVKLATAERWAKLNDLIGQANGEKFKIIAQGYTLNILLLHANKHLSYLSSRYRLQQVEGSLALQVIDRDMGDEVRTIYSLSGGESFLISLALALGLSSLSSRNMKVESLFIDEGFGSLDSESLRLAMEALEQLRMQGRKIGVISHVQEMSERIVTQVILRKMVNGKSRMEIVG